MGGALSECHNPFTARTDWGKLVAWTDYCGRRCPNRFGSVRFGACRSMDNGRRFIRSIQRPDGSWYGSWGVCFTYGERVWESFHELMCVKGTGESCFSGAVGPALFGLTQDHRLFSSSAVGVAMHGRWSRNPPQASGRTVVSRHVFFNARFLLFLQMGIRSCVGCSGVSNTRYLAFH